LKHLKNDPDQTIPPRKRGRPKTKTDPDPAIPKVDRTRRDVTRKDLISQLRRYNIKGCTRLSKEQLLHILSKVKKLFFEKDDLQLTKDQLINIGKENNIKVNLRKRKDNIIEAILKTQDSVFREITASELSFQDDLIEPTKEERKPAYTITETRTRRIRKLNATETDFTIKVNKTMETEKAINALIAHAKRVGNYQKVDKITIVVSNLHFHHDISTVVKSDVKATEFMKHIAKILSSNEHLDITQCRFNVKIFSIPHGSGKCAKIINLVNDVRTKRCITQIKNNDYLCCPRAIVTALTYHTDEILGAKRNIEDIRDGRKVQTELAKELCKRPGDYNEEGFTLEDIKNVEELLNVQIKVVCAESFNSTIYS